MVKLVSAWKILLACLFFTLFIGAPRIAHAASFAQAEAPASERVRLMIKLDTATQNDTQIAIASTVATAESILPQIGWQVVEVDASEADATIAKLQATAGVLEVTPDYPLELAWSPDDPGYTEGTQWALDKIGADVAWEFSTGQTITVAVLDSGIDHKHPEFVGRVVPGYNFVDKNTDTTDLCGHGTHVAGIIAAEANNAVGVAGVAHQAAIMPLKVIGDNCMGSYSRLMQAITYAVDHGVRILSITSGGAYDHSGLHDALIYAREQGVLVVVAAGNRGNALPFYPGSFAESFTIAGTDQADQKYNNSNFGQQIDMSAPATNIYNTYYDKEKGSTYAYLTGTSMAAPHVAAVAALILAIDPKLSLADLENTLISSAADLGEAGWDEIFGWGRVTAWRAVAAVSPAAGNIRIGHFRVPKMASFNVADVEANADADSIQLSWTQADIAADHTVVIYRSIVPVFEAATDIAEIPAVATGSYDDTEIEVDQEYHYWLVQADNDVEIAITEALNAKVSSTAEPNEPIEPAQPGQAFLFIPKLQR
ncbi:MAG: S8 family serine peptidase [Caldilineaceae bacterium]|nr:S8 family serine peptidase [Caldilineaceae bacterium]